MVLIRLHDIGGGVIPVPDSIKWVIMWFATNGNGRWKIKINLATEELWYRDGRFPINPSSWRAADDLVSYRRSIDTYRTLEEFDNSWLDEIEFI